MSGEDLVEELSDIPEATNEPPGNAPHRDEAMLANANDDEKYRWQFNQVQEALGQVRDEVTQKLEKYFEKDFKKQLRNGQHQARLGANLHTQDPPNMQERTWLAERRAELALQAMSIQDAMRIQVRPHLAEQENEMRRKMRQHPSIPYYTEEEIQAAMGKAEEALIRDTLRPQLVQQQMNAIQLNQQMSDDEKIWLGMHRTEELLRQPDVQLQMRDFIQQGMRMPNIQTEFKDDVQKKLREEFLERLTLLKYLKTQQQTVDASLAQTEEILLHLPHLQRAVEQTERLQATQQQNTNLQNQLNAANAQTTILQLLQQQDAAFQQRLQQQEIAFQQVLQQQQTVLQQLLQGPQPTLAAIQQQLLGQLGAIQNQQQAFMQQENLQHAADLQAFQRQLTLQPPANPAAFQLQYQQQQAAQQQQTQNLIALQNQIANLQIQSDQAQIQAATLQTQLTATQNQNAQLQTQVNTAITQGQNLATQVANTQNQIQGVQTQMIAAQNRQANLVTHVNAMADQAVNLRLLQQQEAQFQQLLQQEEAAFQLLLQQPLPPQAAIQQQLTTAQQNIGTQQTNDRNAFQLRLAQLPPAAQPAFQEQFEKQQAALLLRRQEVEHRLRSWRQEAAFKDLLDQQQVALQPLLQPPAQANQAAIQQQLQQRQTLIQQQQAAIQQHLAAFTQQETAQQAADLILLQQQCNRLPAADQPAFQQQYQSQQTSLQQQTQQLVANQTQSANFKNQLNNANAQLDYTTDVLLATELDRVTAITNQYNNTAAQLAIVGAQRTNLATQLATAQTTLATTQTALTTAQTALGAANTDLNNFNNAMGKTVRQFNIDLTTDLATALTGTHHPLPPPVVVPVLPPPSPIPPGFPTPDDQATQLLIQNNHPNQNNLPPGPNAANPQRINNIAAGGKVSPHAKGLWEGVGTGNEQRIVLHHQQMVAGARTDVYTVLSKRQASSLGFLKQWEKDIKLQAKGRPPQPAGRVASLTAPTDSPALDGPMNKIKKFVQK